MVAVAVLSGNRNFEGRIHPLVRANYLASPPLVVAYALAGRMDLDLTTESLGEDTAGKPVFLRDIWPTPQEIEKTVRDAVTSEMYQQTIRARFLKATRTGNPCLFRRATFIQWDPKSTYIKTAAVFRQHAQRTAAAGRCARRARAGHAGRQRNHRSHFAGGFHSQSTARQENI